jgi:tetrahydromethanopterin S-methyltransferase subunit B
MKRPELITLICKEAGLTPGKSNLYLTKRQMEQLLLTLRTTNDKIKELTEYAEELSNSIPIIP